VLKLVSANYIYNLCRLKEILKQICVQILMIDVRVLNRFMCMNGGNSHSTLVSLLVPQMDKCQTCGTWTYGV
jgi:hypothetical protein